MALHRNVSHNVGQPAALVQGTDAAENFCVEVWWNRQSIFGELRNQHAADEYIHPSRRIDDDHATPISERVWCRASSTSP